MNRVIYFPAIAVINNILSGVGGPFTAYLAKKGGKRKIFILRPAIERMVVTLGAL
jgi:hypothetical protein